jgi:hypothetical protein
MSIGADLTILATPDPLGVHRLGLAELLLGPLVFALIGLVFIGPAIVIIGMPVIVLWAVLVRWLISRLAPPGVEKSGPLA